MNASGWKHLTVQAFVDELTSALDPNSTSAKVDATVEATVWQKQSVQNFFAALPWNPITAVVDQQQQGFSLKLPVAQYFKHFQWSSSMPLNPEKSDTSTSSSQAPSLKDFSNLF